MGQGHTHSHGAGHSHGPSQGHSHDHASGANERQTLIAACLTVSFMGAEIVGGLWSGSLALLADAGHMLTDTVALVFAWLGFRLARRPESPSFTYGLKRLPVLVAYTSGLSMFVISFWVLTEAIGRMRAPVPVAGGMVILIAVLGLFINIGVFWILTRADRENLNIRGAVLHVIGDLLGSVAAIIAGTVIYFTGWMPIDPLLSLLVAVLLAFGAWRLTRDAGRLLLQAVPEDHDIAAISAEIAAAIPGVLDIHHVHIWSLADRQTIITLHAQVEPETDGDAVVVAVKELLRSRHGIGHATVEIEKGPCADGAGAAGPRAVA
ncbi:MAG: cation transporter [Hyphomicrobiales bacterium]|nr:MAG: cation transporter [Hyphomicrobiales bacterium]